MYNKDTITDMTYEKEKLNTCYKIITRCKDFEYIYYVFIDKVTGLNNLEFGKNVYPEPIILTSKANLSKKDTKTHELNIFYERELSFNYISNIGNNTFILMDKQKMEGIVNSLKKSVKTVFKKDIDDDKEIKIFYTKERYNDIFGVIYKSSNGSIGTNFTRRFYKNIRI